MTTPHYDYDGKVAFTTGAGSGLGRTTALAFARAGAQVAAVGLHEGPIADTVRQIDRAGGSAIAIPCDVADDDQIKAAVDKTVDAFGRLDYAYNNAGVEPTGTPAAEIPSEVWQRNLAINLSGVFYCLKHQVPVMLERGGGAIVNASSGAGIRGFSGHAIYCASKFGVIGLTKSAAFDYAASNIRINAICPGIIATVMIDRVTGGTDQSLQDAISQEPIGRLGRPDEIADTVLWLCSDAATFTVGAAIVIDGGQTI